MSIDKNTEQIIAWIAIPRTGTNFLCSLIYHHPLITSYYEIFHPQKFYSGYKSNVEEIIKYINQRYQQNFSDPTDSNLITWIHHNPEQLLLVLIHFNPDKYISFKLFPDHLEKKTIESTIINNPKVKRVLIKRNLLAAYISHEIALKTNQWNNFDTSEIKMKISVEKFTNWVTWANNWYELFESYNELGEPEHYIINYEDIHAHHTNLDKLIYLDRFLKNTGMKSQQPYQLPSSDRIKIMSKQDKRENLADKIVNYQEFIQELKKRGLAFYLNL